MKKFLSNLLAFVMVFTSAFISVPVNAQLGTEKLQNTKEDEVISIRDNQNLTSKPEVGHNSRYKVILEEPSSSNNEGGFSENGGTFKFRYDSVDLNASDIEYLVFKDGKKIDYKFSTIIAHDGQAMDGIEFNGKLDKNETNKDQIYEIYIKEKKDPGFDSKNILKFTVFGKTEKQEIVGLSKSVVTIDNKSTSREIDVNIFGKELNKEVIKYDIEKTNEKSPDLQVSILDPFYTIPASAKIIVNKNTLGDDYSYKVHFYLEGGKKKTLEIKVLAGENISPQPTEDDFVKEVTSKNSELDSKGGNITLKILTNNNSNSEIEREVLINGEKIDEGTIEGNLNNLNGKYIYSANLPKNDTDKDMVYNFKFKGKDDKLFKNKIITVKSSKAVNPPSGEDFSIGLAPNNEKEYSLEAKAGDLSFGVVVTNKPSNDNIILISKLDGEIINLNYIVSGEKAKRTIKVTFPENTTSKEQTYYLYVKPKGKENELDNPLVTVKVSGANIINKEDLIKELNVKFPELSLKGGEQTITLKGVGLNSAKDIKLKLFDISDGKSILLDKNSYSLEQEFIGNDKIKTAKIRLNKVERDTEYKLVVEADGVIREIQFSQIEGANTNEPQIIVPKKSFIVDDKTLIMEFYTDIFPYKEDSIKKGITINENIKALDKDKVKVEGNFIKLTFDSAVFADMNKSYKIYVDQRTLMDAKKNPNKQFTSEVIKDDAIVLESKITKGYQNPSKNSQVVYELKGHNLNKNLKFKIQKNNKQKEIYYSSDEENNKIKDFKIEGSDKEKTITFTAPENTSKSLETYTIMVSVNGGANYYSTLGATLEDRFKKSIIAVFPEGADTKKPAIDFIQIQSYGTQGGGESADITHTNLPTNQESKKTLLWISGTNLDASKSRIRFIDENGVYLSPIYDSSHDSGNRILMTMLDGMKDGKSFGMTGKGNNMLMEVILPNAYKPKEGHDGRVYKYEVAADGVNFNEDVTVTANVVNDDYKDKITLDDKLINVTVRHVNKSGKDIIKPRSIKAYKHLPPNVFHYMLPIYTENGEYKGGFLGYKLGDSDELVKGREDFGHSIHYYYDKNVPELINSKGEIVLVYNVEDISKPGHSSNNKSDIHNDENDLKDKLINRIRVFGKDRYYTSIEISKKTFEKAETVVIATGKDFSDSLAASALAGIKDAPVLLTKEGVTGEIEQEIKRLGASKIILVGGEKSISNQEYKFYSNLGDIERISGNNRYKTSLNIAKKIVKLNPKSNKVIITDGRNYPDALAISGYSYGNKIPIILSNFDDINYSKDFLKENGINEAIIIGGENSVSKKVEKEFKKVTRISGKDRYDTALQIKNKLYPNSKKIIVASGENYADALCGSSLAGKNDAASILVKKKDINPKIKEMLDKFQNKDITVLGGENSISNNLVKQLINKK